MAESIIIPSDDIQRSDVPRGLPLIVVLRGISDAGSVIEQCEEYLWEHSEQREILRFDADILLDYRSRRPVITFEVDHLKNYEAEELVLSLAQDELGTPYLLLSGFEPDFRWNACIDAVLQLIDEFEVRTTVWLQAIPMPVPHTRQLGMTVSGSREEFIAERSLWKPTTQLSASLAHVLEYRLCALGEDVVGLTVLVPHYLANTEYPGAFLTVLDAVMAATGLIFATSGLNEANQDFLNKVSQQVRENDESRELVQMLETRYDLYVSEQSSQPKLVHDEDEIPTAEQLASELERFLAEQQGLGDDSGSAAGPSAG